MFGDLTCMEDSCPSDPKPSVVKALYLSVALARMPIVVYTKEALMIDNMMFDFASSNIKPPPMMMGSTTPDLDFSQVVAANHAQISDAQNNKVLLMTHQFKDIAHVFEDFTKVGIIQHTHGGCGDGGTISMIAAIALAHRFQGSLLEVLEYAHGSGVPKTIKGGLHVTGE